MLNRLRAFRERGWREVDAPIYAQAWQRFGGSVATHPLVVEQLAEMAGIPVRYLGWESAGELVAAIPTWGRHLALSKDVLKRRGKKGLYDLGNAELILPVAGDARIALRHGGRYLSALHERNIVTLRPQTEQLAFARAPEDFSKKFRYNQRREVRLVEEAGGQVRQADSFAPAEFAAIYLELFQRRWGFPATGAERMAEVFERLRELLRGSVLLLNDRPIAVQVLYRAEAPGWLSVEYINGGVDPQTREFSPGSVLSYLNTQAAWEEARALGKPLRYSFGRADREYKDRWCHPSPVFQV
ncbi:antimicrobial resistance protein Mig-14 [Pseudomonas aeruginosa]|uniref:antimicrobial resistance protein Mig-14 n=1 Tax=Pseudomonas aeruginosa TaxID=287 RepID=UPI001F4CB94D|nr:antimicrobial resistance protein Mig-14 [Pseudomonas aeruginosa]UTQ26169.1 antimicrobial resistance protein Mig-14 [Pseudomonas aeruginosa]